jgi:hypothetical protein
MRGTRFLALTGFGLGLWLFAAPGAARGQDNTWAGAGVAAMVESARWRLGILRINAALELANAGYNSDIYFGQFAAPVPDGIFSARVPVQVLVPLNRNIVLDLYNSPRYDFYLDTKRERAWNDTVSGLAHFIYDRVYFRMGGELSNNRRHMSQELDIPVREIANRLDGLVLWQATRATSLSLHYAGATLNYGNAQFGETSLAEVLNRKVDSFDLAAYIQPNPRFRFFVTSQYGHIAFAAASSRFKNARSYAVLGGFNSVIQEEAPSRAGGIVGGASLGYQYFNVLEAGQADGSGLVGAADLSVGILALTTARIFFSRSFQFSIYSGTSRFIQMTYGAGISRLLSNMTSISYDLSFGQSTYPAAGASAGAPSGSARRYTVHRASLNITLSRNLRIALAGSVGRRMFAVTNQAKNRSSIGLSLVYGASPGTGSNLSGGTLSGMGSNMSGGISR